MAHAIAFDYGGVLDKAMGLFWRDGYAGTSLRDLLKVMGIGEGSFYNTFKSKKQLYVACLNRYEEIEGAKRGRALMSAPSARAGIRALFAALLDCLDDPETPSRLCMMAAMVSEEVLAEPDLRERVEAGLFNLQARFIERLEQDAAAGLLPRDLDSQATAAVVMTYLQGLWRMAMVSYDRHRFERQIDVFLTSLSL
ncbi:TetR/AcrR family transcriptional regulator [Lichenihabitans psoromatis]|uniref:TetR/AcrR family transcriptional regulator n=1 Tax=Lichenihabitans psoromatis TaxID=2528642 RepID=UPI001035F315|nr:TetR/AcrR family transcriptional regulator [Lichenihabitans psoromatis]